MENKQTRLLDTAARIQERQGKTVGLERDVSGGFLFYKNGIFLTADGPITRENGDTIGIAVVCRVV